MNNQELINTIRDYCVTEGGKELVTQLETRWNAFWDQDHRTLARQKALIDRLQAELLEDRREPCSKCESRKFQNDELKKVNAELRGEIEYLKRENKRLFQYVPNIKARDAVQMVPPFEVYDEIRPITIARLVRLFGSM